ncbi:reprolysin-like metallopeptidase [Frigoriflavimonas asaccharolytica]|uniref:Secreted protein (Por secretion system target) n=1 Tax=Frigoriflavimonas asaccharolytica TaxID=2735899 RepID=A0A8J8G8H6_9FLAO|nr:zinc-dependent metalloprotease family protein [Frigoriflavimonas asaccharolytica]NRS91439.1 hypothetical protein [Frigoriflavimonas asaccharolytica]
MKIKLLIFTFLIFFSVPIFAQQNEWTKANERNIGKKHERGAIVSKFELFNLNLENLKNQLSKASDRDILPRAKGVLVKFPTESGSFATYEVFESSTMHPDLQKKYSDIKSYMGVNIENPLSTVTFAVDPYFGFNASFKNETDMFYLETYTKDNSTYILYNRNNATSLSKFQCLVDENKLQREISTGDNSQKTVIDGIKRTYRLAITTSTEYSDFMITAAGISTGTDAQKKAAVLAGVNLAVARLNQVFENELALRMVLIPNTDLLFFLTTDTFDAASTGQMLGENVTVTNAIIGASNYDLGHIFYSGGGGGLAGLGVICGNGKAGGVTGTGSPIGDPFVIDYVAHEMGHQMGGNHTQNNSCNRSANNAMEPGSASTIMGYAGICAPDVQGNSDPYYHANSIREMYTILTGSGNCGVKTATGNNEPTANLGEDKTIPRDTPFALKSISVDPEGDPITYSFEQMDKDVALMPPRGTNAVGPMFRSINPSTSSTRYFPRLITIVQGYDPTILATTDFRAWEKLSSVSRILNFSVLVRDNNPFGGQTKRDDIKVIVTAAAGPFIVTSQNVANTVWELGKPTTITWNVANTTAAPISTTDVTILLSTDNGVTFPIVLKDSTPNNGTYTFAVPEGLGKTDNARIMIKAIDNIFLNVNIRPFSINSTIIDPEETFTTTDIVVYPVPSYDGFVYIKAQVFKDLAYTIFAMDGKLIKPTKLLPAGNILEKIDVSAYPIGTYIIQLENETGSFTKKLIIAK